MNYPYYEDFTRTCIQEFKQLVIFSKFDFCDSNQHKECIFYNTLAHPENNCKHGEKCIKMHLYIPTEQFQLDINGLNQMAKHYCFTENRTNCAIYNQFESGKEVSSFLHPDGSMIKAEM